MFTINREAEHTPPQTEGCNALIVVRRGQVASPDQAQHGKRDVRVCKEPLGAADTSRLFLRQGGDHMAHVTLTYQQDRWLWTRPVDEQQHIRDLLATGDYALATMDGGGTFVVVIAESEDDPR